MIEAVANAVAVEFGLGTVTGPVLMAARGAMGEVFRVETDSGVYAVKRLFAWNDGLGVDGEAAFTAQARAAGIAVPLEMRSRSSDLVVTVEGVRFRAYEWVELGAALEPPLAPEWAEQVGEILGRLHAMSEIDETPLDGWYTDAPKEERWLKLEELVGFDLEGLKAVAASHVSGPRITCHRDFAPSNLYPVADGLVLLDWEDVGPFEASQELAGALLNWCTDDLTASAPSVTGFLKGYAKHYPVPKLTVASYAITATVWLNFLAAQAEASLDPDAESEHREFGREKTAAMLAKPLKVDLLEQVATAVGAAFVN